MPFQGDQDLMKMLAVSMGINQCRDAIAFYKAGGTFLTAVTI